MTAARPEAVSVAALDLGYSEEQDQLRELVHGFLAENSTEEDVRRLMKTEAGFDEPVWKRMASELGLAGLAIPEEFGGAGLSAVELGVVLEEMGRVLYCGPFLSTAVMATTALLESGDAAACAELLPEIASGERRMALAIDETGRAGFDPAQVAVRACDDGDETFLDGLKECVIDGASAHSILVVARGRDGLGLFHVEGTANGLERTPIPELDPTRKLARIRLQRTPATRVLADEPAILRTHHRIIAALASEQVGGAQRCLDLAVEYARERIQFGRPIGSFQSIKHKCADLLVRIEAAKSAARYAAVCAANASEASDESGASDTGDDLAIAAHMAKSYCSDAYVRAAEENLQIHGGIGFTWEHSCHLYLKRARSSQLLFGDPLLHRDRLAALLGV